VKELAAPAGANLMEVCQSAGIDVFRGIWRGLHCGGVGLGKLLPAGTCGRCKLWVKPDAASGVNPPTGKEKVHPKIDGMYRLACQVRVLGDMDVTTKPGWQEFVESSEWNRDPRADGSKWMERWRKAKAGGTEKEEPAAEPES